MNANHLAAAIESKYGLCADTAVHKDGTFEITRWDNSIAGISKPSNEQLESDVAEYMATVLPIKVADGAERGALENNRHKAMELIIRLAFDINQAQPNILSPKTKQLTQELKALLRP